MCCCGAQGNIYFLCGISALFYAIGIFGYPGFSKVVSIVLFAMHVLMIRGAASRNEGLLRMGKVVAIVLMVLTLIPMVVLPFSMSFLAAFIDVAMSSAGGSKSYRNQMNTTGMFAMIVIGMEIGLACGLAWDYGKYYNCKVLLNECRAPAQLAMVVTVPQPHYGVQMVGAPPPPHPPGYPVDQKV